MLTERRHGEIDVRTGNWFLALSAIPQPNNSNLAPQDKQQSRWCRLPRLLLLLLAVTLAVAGCRSWRITTLPGKKKPADEVLKLLATHLDRDAWHVNSQWSLRANGAMISHGRSSKNQPRWSFGRERIDDYVDALSHKAGTESSADEFQSAVTSVAARREQPDPSPGDGRESKTAQSESDQSDDTASPTSPPHGDSAKSSPDESETWDGFWPMDVLQVLDRQQSADGRRNPSTVKPAQSPSSRYLAALATRDNLVGWNAAILWAQRDPAAAYRISTVLKKLVTKRPHYEVQAVQSTDASTDSSPLGKSLIGAPTSQDSPSENSSPNQTTSHRISPAMQAAATEAWCLVLAESSNDPLQSLAPPGRLLEKTDVPNEIRGELFRGIARWIAPALIPRLDFAMATSEPDQQPPTAIRRAAIEACVIHALQLRHHETASTSENGGRDVSSVVPALSELEPNIDDSLWPESIWNCETDQDSKVRSSFGLWLAVTKHPDAFRILKLQLRETRFSLRGNAMLHLGILGTQEAREELLKQAARPEARIREFAIKGLSHWGVSSIASFAHDPKYNVRRTVASELGRFANVQAAVVVKTLVTDVNPQVRAAAVQSVADWPDKWAAPVLLDGMRDGSFLTRKQCHLQLNRRLGARIPFRLSDSQEQRHVAVSQLARRWNLPVDYLDALQTQRIQPSRIGLQQRRHHVEAVLWEIAQASARSAAIPTNLERITQRLTTDDVPLIEKHLGRLHPSQAEVLYRDVLPALHPAYQGLSDLASRDLLVRRSAARRLAALGTQSSLSPAVLRRLWVRLAHEQDQLVWRSAFTAVTLDATEEAARLAHLAAGHHWPDIRILGCRYISRHGQPSHAHWLLPLLGDANVEVRLAAAEAAGACHNPAVLDGNQPQNSVDIGNVKTTTGLRALLTDSDHRIRLAAMVSMSRLGDAQAMQEMIRRMYEPDFRARSEIIQQMGRTGQTRFVEPLIRLAWTESNHHVNRSILASLEQLVPSDNHAHGIRKTTSDDQKIQLWVTWWETRQAKYNRTAGSQVAL